MNYEVLFIISSSVNSNIIANAIISHNFYIFIFASNYFYHEHYYYDNIFITIVLSLLILHQSSSRLLLSLSIFYCVFMFYCMYY